MADPFNLDLTASQINTALNNANDSDKAPVSGAANLVNSNNIYSFVTSQVEAEETAREAADDSLDTRVATLEGAMTYAKFTKGSGLTSGSSSVSGYTETDPDGIASESSGIITITGSGLFLVSFNIVYSLGSNVAHHIGFRSDGNVLISWGLSEAVGAFPVAYSTLILSTGSFTLDIRILSNITVVRNSAEISVVKLS